MKKELSSDAQDYLSWITEDTLIDPDDWFFHIDFGNGRELANAQLTRSLVRAPLVEINYYKPNFLSTQIKKDFNLMRIANQDDLIPTEAELSRLKDKLQKIAEDSLTKFWVKCLKKDPEYKIGNSIVSAWMIDVQDIIDFLNGESVEIIYYRVIERRIKIDRLN